MADEEGATTTTTTTTTTTRKCSCSCCDFLWLVTTNRGMAQACRGNHDLPDVRNLGKFPWQLQSGIRVSDLRGDHRLHLCDFAHHPPDDSLVREAPASAYTATAWNDLLFFWLPWRC
ncbi:hypothetical protein OS493_020374 [Desmophyllum pertusum]|uniref:Uncharacterized protein n=1 Tax=Desmophyllum pertusum TaxID=174260 RepID=A0A9W9ZNC0_9CNID|nr:hypothetical protein OS493_020374 [Desmophyllum pertusum]